jgi:carbon-monoxide dehydrogenase medium subunit/6-hydroxypseudooxynicotine dehydrogenase subunit alpha
VKAPPFAYARAGSLDDALTLLSEAGDDAKLLAGGQSLVPLLAFRVARPTHLVDIDAIDALAGIEETPDGLRVGALTRHETLARANLTGGERLLAEAASHVGHVPIRMRGTIGGSLAHADPSAELPVALLALDGHVLVRSATAERAIAAGELFVGPFTTALAPGEVLVAVVVPGAARTRRHAFGEFTVRSGDFALASVAVVLALDDGKVDHARVALGGVDATPIRASGAEALLAGSELTDELVEEAAAAAAAECDPAEDATTTAAYRRRLVARLVRDALTRIRAGEPS